MQTIEGNNIPKDFIVIYDRKKIVYHTTSKKNSEAILSGGFETGHELGVAERRHAIYFSDLDVNKDLYARNREGEAYDGEDAGYVPADIKGLRLLNMNYMEGGEYSNYKKYRNAVVAGRLDDIPYNIDGTISFLEDGRIYEVALKKDAANASIRYGTIKSSIREHIMGQLLNESNISSAYHFTRPANFIEMVERNKLEMSLAYGNSKEERYGEGKYPYFLSTTQYKGGRQGFGLSLNYGSFMLELNIPYMSSKGIFRRVDFFKDYGSLDIKVGHKISNMDYESEDRFLTKFAWLPFDKAVKSVTAKSGYSNPSMTKEAMDALSDMGIPLLGTAGVDGERHFYGNADEAATYLIAFKGRDYAQKKMSEINVSDAVLDPKYHPSKSNTEFVLKKNRFAKLLFRDSFAEYMGNGRPFSDLVADVTKTYEKYRDGWNGQS